MKKIIAVLTVLCVALGTSADRIMTIYHKTGTTSIATGSIDSVTFVKDTIIFDNGNISVVQSNPTAKTQIWIFTPTEITMIRNYHYLNLGHGVGTIALRHNDGTRYGAWPCFGSVGQGGVPNAYWTANPMTAIKPGLYTVFDSDSVTWSQNSGSGNAGMTYMEGYKHNRDTILFDNGNIGGVQSNPANPTQFTITTQMYVSYIRNYHYFNGGALPGTISLRHSDGTTYGPWQTFGTLGQGGVANANWHCFPNTAIKAGTYTVVDSDPATWSQNSQSGNRGFSYIHGFFP